MIELAFIRNRLSCGVWLPEDREVLVAARGEAASAASPYRDLALNAIDNALKDLGEGLLEQARLELNFIHNLDLRYGFPDAWHEQCFLGTSVSTYLDQVQDLDRVRRVLVLLGEAVTAQEQNPEYRLRRRMDRAFRPTWKFDETDKLVWVGGRPGVGLDEREKYVMQTYGGEVLWEAAVHWEPAAYHRPAWTGWPEAGAVLLGGGQEIYALDLDSGVARYHQVLDNYFMRLAITPDRTRLLIIDGTSVAALDLTLRELWRTPVAVDGIILHEWDDERIRLEAELDPPGGWKPVVLDAKTGRILEDSAR